MSTLMRHRGPARPAHPWPTTPAGRPLTRRSSLRYHAATAQPGPRPSPPQIRSCAARARWNAVKTAVLLATLGGSLVLVGSLLGRAGAVIGLALGVATVGGSYWFADRLALRAGGAVPVTRRQLPEYYRTVHELSQAAGLPMPRLYVTPDLQPNAFATGRSPRHAAVAVTRGLLEMLTPQELRAVLAHELAHVRNRDVLLTSVAAALATGITYLAELAGWLPFAAREDDEDPGWLSLLLAALLAPVAATLLQLALSRSREFEADRTGAELAGSGRDLASALVKIDRAARDLPMAVEPTQAAKYLVNPLRGGRPVLATLFSTHPDTAARVSRLAALRTES